MQARLEELRYKEVISISSGIRFGFAEDLLFDTENGQINALVIPGRRRLFGLLGREEDRYIPWSAIRRLGDDIILVEEDTLLKL
ncbi:MAG: YlmC/YmxH family sporulation protein [Lawsonibacter sp.]|jgi:YlmC/YmxH family sporulation protein